jgi:hypothetical protein
VRRSAVLRVLGHGFFQGDTTLELIV